MFKKAEITFLGTGTSIGVPVIGCSCDVCTSDDPKNQRLRSSIHVRTAETALIVDTGPDFRQQCLREGITELDAVVFTHSHSDHVMGFDDLRRFTVLDREMPVFAPAETIERLEAAFPYVFDGKNRYPGYLKVATEAITGAFSVGDLEISPLPVNHGKVDTIGLLFSSGGERLFAYVPDAKELAPETVEAIRGIDLLILDGLQLNPHPTHLSIPEAVEIAQHTDVDQTWLTHFSCRVDYTEIEPTLPKNVRLAWDGLRLEVG